LAVKDIVISQLIVTAESALVNDAEEIEKWTLVEFSRKALNKRADVARPSIADLLASERGSRLEADKKIADLVGVGISSYDEDSNLFVATYIPRNGCGHIG
jgi:hypothetical protein